MPKALGTCALAQDSYTSPPIRYLPITPYSLSCPPLLMAGSPSRAQVTQD